MCCVLLCVGCRVMFRVGFYMCLLFGLTCLFDCLMFPCCVVSLCSFVLFLVLLIVFVVFACPSLLLLRLFVLSVLCVGLLAVFDV